MPDVLVVGSGAREHALAWKLVCSRHVRQIYVAPGNAGTALMANNLALAVQDVRGIAEQAHKLGVSLVVVGPEVPLVGGLADACRDLELNVFGPSARAARIEGSKAYAKALMKRCGVPTPPFQVFDDFEAAADYVREAARPLVVKADGLAAGKGVSVCDGPDDAVEALEHSMVKQAFGPAGSRVVIEERLSGREVSFMAFVSDDVVVPMVAACDYKRIGDGDQGPNTGGMGAYSPPPWFTPELQQEALDHILVPVARGMKEDGAPFRGVLYAGLMLTEAGLEVLEFNCRFGDPETQVVLPRLESDLYEVMQAVATGRLQDLRLEWSEQAVVGVVLASEGYPGKFETGFRITGLGDLDDGVLAFHAGTRLGRVRGWDPYRKPKLFGRERIIEADSFTGDIETDGGRVATLVARGDTLEIARERAYQNVPRVRFDNMYFRTDIALREIAPAPLPDANELEEARERAETAAFGSGESPPGKPGAEGEP